jgi:hypothetical protein
MTPNDKAEAARLHVETSRLFRKMQGAIFLLLMRPAENLEKLRAVRVAVDNLCTLLDEPSPADSPPKAS